MVALERAGIAFTVHTYEHADLADRSAKRVGGARPEGYGIEAAEALGLDPAVVFKTLVADADAELVVGVVPVTGELDLKSLAHAVGAKKATMADPAVAARVTGYVVGGISPLGQKRRLRTVVDASALDHPLVYVSGGRRGLDLGVEPTALVTATAATTAAISRSRA
ncbi:aminoacyl-tRNA deacylase [Nocardioides marmoriginsengisoli]|uniref:Cys-tRNA(Pro)/Cys-tRNA(Cys) deacylase n=2 Tax=Nocardioides marmoriginsengisoli TaxID=661483 RepID=A0A3N0CND8_9ACTN|nr:aminoacyl-tRNA deacylase [Nocardioides marmoriginsengisoli]